LAIGILANRIVAIACQTSTPMEIKIGWYNLEVDILTGY
jgi:hypothetical protein